MNRAYSLLCVLMLTASSMLAATIFVDVDATGTNNGSSWTNAYTVFQTAIDAAAGGDEIWVAAGTYLPTSGTGRERFFRTKPNVEWYGGFSGDETAVSERENFGRGGANETILSGDLNNSNTLDNSDAYHVLLQPLLSTDLTAIVDGFSFVGGNANHASDTEGQRGAAIYVDDEDFTIRNCTFYGNYAADAGGAAYIFSGAPNLLNCIFEDNSTGGAGGAIAISDGSTVDIDNSLVRNNSAVNGGGLSITTGSSYVLNNVTITSNSATTLGGGIHLLTSGGYTLNNTVLWGNTAATGNEANLQAGSATLNYSLYGNSGNDVAGAGTFTAVNNNLTSDPLFFNAAAGNYTPAYNSPMLDAGDNTLNSTTNDIRGGAFGRKLNSADATAGTIDIGAYEYKFGVDANIPSVVFYQPTKQTFNTLLYNGAVSDDGNLTVQRGFVYSESANPLIGSATLINSGTGEGSFQSLLQDQPEGTYYAKAWATNALGTTYSPERSYIVYPIAVDGNQDGTADSLQPHVFTILSSNGETYITLVSEIGTTLYDVTVRNTNDEEEAYYYPYGMVGFKIDASTATVSLIFHSSSDLSTGRYKKLDSLGRYKVFSSANYSIQTIGGQEKAVVSLELIDGGLGDYDETENGTIHDPGGPQLPVAVIIPVWDYWWVALLLGGGWFAWRRRR